MKPFDERDGIEALAFLGAVAIFALFGGLSRLLYEWPHARGLARSFGNLMVSVFCAWLVGLALWESMGPDHPALLMSLTGAAAWLGGDVIDRIARHLLNRAGGGTP